jgi:hypothetical protein
MMVLLTPPSAIAASGDMLASDKLKAGFREKRTIVPTLPN